MRLLGLDVGSKRIGISLSDELNIMASPHSVYERQGMAKDAQYLTSTAKENSCSAIVVGLPLELDGSEGQRVKRVRILAHAMEPLFEGEILFFDERFSTVEAERVLLSADMRREKRKKVVDKVAAAIILQGYLDSK
jgi:putative pre-16S rRNA nuclease